MPPSVQLLIFINTLVEMLCFGDEVLKSQSDC